MRFIIRPFEEFLQLFLWSCFCWTKSAKRYITKNRKYCFVGSKLYNFLKRPHYIKSITIHCIYSFFFICFHYEILLAHPIIFLELSFISQITPRLILVLLWRFTGCMSVIISPSTYGHWSLHFFGGCVF